MKDLEATLAPGVSNLAFDDLDGRNRPAVLKRLRGYLYCQGGTTSSLIEPIRFGLMRTSGFAPGAAEFDATNNNIWEQECTAFRDTSNDIPAFLHFDLKLRIVIPFDVKTWFSILNTGSTTDFITTVARLFWALI